MADELSRLKPVPGSQTARTRIGRGQGSGLGKTAGRGTKGQQARAGYTRRFGFEGGQMPLQRRLPKVGFRNYNKTDFEIVNVGKLGGLAAGSVVDADSLKAAGIISRKGRDGVKLLGNGELTVKLVVRLAKVSLSARAKIEAAGGSVEDLA
ncbi:MAG: 50S ribosomal protein L15 [Myxococcales bacterium]|nr:50S ribosomal protein L15 [Myxococcales bacterium]